MLINRKEPRCETRLFFIHELLIKSLVIYNGVSLDEVL